jgi:hypothetical protein
MSVENGREKRTALGIQDPTYVAPEYLGKETIESAVELPSKAWLILLLAI